MQVLCEDGTKHNADHLIITVSLGVLKEKLVALTIRIENQYRIYKNINFFRQESMFSPQLPEIKQNAINGIGFGTVDKIFLMFSEPFWPQDWTGFSILWDEETLSDMQRRHGKWLRIKLFDFIFNYILYSIHYMFIFKTKFY